MTNKGKKKLPLRAKIIAVSLASTLSGMLFLLVFNYFASADNAEKMLLDKARLVTTNINISTERYLAKYLQMLDASSRAFVLEDTSSMQNYIGFLDKEVADDPNILGFTIGFPDGSQYFDTASAPKPEDNFDSRTRPWYIDTLKANAPIVTDTYNDDTTGQLVTTVTTPITTNDGVKGVYSVDILVNEMLNELDTYIDKDLGGRLVIYDGDENIILSKTVSFIGKKLSEANEYLNNMANYFKNSNKPYEFVEYDAEKKQEVTSIALKAELKGTDWTVVYIIPRDALFKDANKNALIALIISAVIAIIVMAVSYTAITYSLKDLKKYAAIMIDASRNNDLTVHIPVESNDELGQIAESMNAFIEQIDKIMHDVHLATVDLSSGNNELAATMEELAATFSEQSQQISSMVGSLEHVNQTSRDTAFAMNDNMKSLEGTAARTSEETEKLAIVSDDMNQIQTNTTNLADTIDRLGQSSTEIGNILSVINDIANQTNLLALNAAIEAARAGEAGRGFAVVADEVRKLAERTQHSIGEIESIIKALQAEVDSAAVEINKSTEAVGSGAENITAVTAEIRHAVEEVTALYDKMKPESEAIESQQVYVQTITDNAMVVASGIEESNSAINEVNITVGHLQERAEKLKAIVERFKI